MFTSLSLFALIFIASYFIFYVAFTCGEAFRGVFGWGLNLASLVVLLFGLILGWQLNQAQVLGKAGLMLLVVDVCLFLMVFSYWSGNINDTKMRRMFFRWASLVILMWSIGITVYLYS